MWTRKQLRQRLVFFLHRKEELVQEASRLKLRLKELASSEDDFRFINYPRRLGQINIQLIQLDKAIESIKDGTYGTCQRCDREIPPARLAVNCMPTALCCVQCAGSDKADAYFTRGARSGPLHFASAD